MKLICTAKARRWRAQAFSLIEAMIAMGVVGVSFVALYSGLTYGFARVEFSRQNHRATQILIEKMETIRLYNWAQVTSPTFIPPKFQANYYPNATGTNAGVVYSGELEITDADIDTNYEDQVKKLTVTVSWNTGKIKRERSLSTYVSEFGLHNSVY